MTPPCERRKDDLASFALGACSEAEMAEIRLHLRECDGCASWVGWLQPAVSLLPESVPQVAPPDRLKVSLMTEVEADARRRLEQSPVPAPTETTRPSLLSRFGWRPALAGLATFTLLVGGVTGYLVASDESAEPQIVAASSARASSNAGGTVEIADGAGTLTAERLPRISDEEVFQVWIERDGQVAPSSIFARTKDGLGSAVIPEIPADADRLIITNEPAGGSETPQGDIVMIAALG